MNPIVKNILAVVVAIIGGSIANMALIQTGHALFPVEGLDPSDIEALTEIMPTLTFEYFIFPFLAHAIGTLVGAAIAFKMAANNNMKFAWGIGAWFLLGGISVNMMIPGPLWFTVLDIFVAYLPMAWLGAKIVSNKS